jgi:hypothetical protein
MAASAGNSDFLVSSLHQVAQNVGETAFNAVADNHPRSGGQGTKDGGGRGSIHRYMVRGHLPAGR